jgi:hypothetical protein
MLAPLLLLWPISIAATNHVAAYIANQPYDQASGRQRHRHRAPGYDRWRPRHGEPAGIGAHLLRADDTDTLYYQVVVPTRG